MDFLKSLVIRVKTASRSGRMTVVLLLLLYFIIHFGQINFNSTSDYHNLEKISNPVSFQLRDVYPAGTEFTEDNFSVISPSQWRCIGPSPTREGFAGRIGFVKYDKRDSNIIYAGGANGGIWKSTDKGITWNPKTDDLPTLSCGAMAIDYRTGTLYFGSGDAVWTNLAYPGNGIYKSSNFGENWSRIETSGLPVLTRFYKIEVDPVRAGYIYAATPIGLLRSTDFASTWNRIIPTGTDTLICSDLTISPDGMNIYAVGPGNYCPFCGTRGIGYWKSSNGGVSFVQKTGTGFPHFTNLPNGRTSISLCESHPSIVYIVTMNDERLDTANFKPYYAYKSTNSGENFTVMNAGDPVLWAGDNSGYNMFIAASPVDSNVCFVGAQNLYKTEDGYRFRCITGYCGVTTRADFHSMDFSHFNPNGLIVGCDGGLYSSENLGLSFANLNASFSLTQIYRIASSPSNSGSILLGVQDMGVLKNSDSAWYVSSLEGDGGAVAYSNVYTYNMVACQDNSGWLFYSNDEGNNWTKAIGYAGSTDWLAPFASHPNYGNTFYTARNNEQSANKLDVYRSVDGGKNWAGPNLNSFSSVQNPDISGLYPTGINISSVNPNLMFLTAGNRYNVFYKPSLIFKSVDGGLSWDQNWIVKGGTGGFPDAYFTQLKTDPAITNELLLTIGGYLGKHVFRSVNAGESWEDITGNLPNFPVNDIVTHYITQSTKEYFVATDHGVFQTMSGAIQWLKTGNNLPNTAATSLDYNRLAGKLRVATFGRSVWETDITGDIFIRDNLYLSALGSGSLTINDNIVICKGASLNIVNDCTIKMAENKKITVLEGGRIDMPENVNAHFTSQSGKWGGIELVGSNPMSIRNSSFSNCNTPLVIKSDPLSGRKDNNQILINHCDFDNGAVLINTRSNVKIVNCNWHYSGGPYETVAAVYSVGSDSVVVVNNRITCTSPTENSIGFDFVWGKYIYVQGNTLINIPVGISVSSNSAYVSGNQIYSYNPSYAYIGIGILNSSDAFVSNNRISSYRQGIKVFNSLPVLFNNVIEDSSSLRGKTSSLYCDRYSNPRLAPVNHNGMFFWDGGKNKLIRNKEGSGIRAIGSSLPDIDYGNNDIFGFRFFVSMNSSSQLVLMARNNCWGGIFPLAYRFDVPGGVNFDPVFCSLSGRYGKFTGEGQMQGLLIIDRGLGFFDTVDVSAALIENDAQKSQLNLGRMQVLQNDFTNAALTFKGFLQNYKSGVNAVEALNKLIYCYDRSQNDLASYYDLRNYYRQISNSGSADSIFILSARDLSRRSLIKSGLKKDALYEFEDAVSSASDSASLISAELSVIDDYALINNGLDSTNFTGRLPYLKPLDLFDAARMVFDRVYNLKGDTVSTDYTLPLKFYLSQNFPNPFNPVTSIYYTVPANVHVKLRVYDVLGRLLGTFIDENKEAGYYVYSFNGANYASGVYFYRIEAGDFVDAKKMVLLK